MIKTVLDISLNRTYLILGLLLTQLFILISCNNEVRQDPENTKKADWSIPLPAYEYKHRESIEKIIHQYPSDKLIQDYVKKKAQFKIFEEKNSIDKLTYSGTAIIDRPVIYVKWNDQYYSLYAMEYKILDQYENK